MIFFKGTTVTLTSNTTSTKTTITTTKTSTVQISGNNFIFTIDHLLLSKYEDINITRLIFTIKWYLADHYIPHSGACRNENDRYDDKGSGSGNSLLSCKQSCDVTQGCGAVSWNGLDHCYMTSQIASTTSENEWTCYSKVCL